MPVAGSEDVLAELPRTHRLAPNAPVRDAFVEGWTAGFEEYQDIAARAASQCNPMMATGDYLRSFAEERGVIPGANESESSIRDRLFSAPNIVTPDAIRSAIDKLLADYTPYHCTLSELELDGMFAHDGTGTWDCYVGADPDYPDRYYDDQPWLLPGGAVPSAGYIRSFLVRLPVLEDNDTTIAYALNLDNDGLFVEDGTGDGVVGLPAFVDPQRADDLYATIVGLIETIKGQGISWAVVVDPSISS